MIAGIGIIVWIFVGVMIWQFGWLGLLIACVIFLFSMYLFIIAGVIVIAMNERRKKRKA